ncbi:hypothetical protein BS47DRAFT_1335217 [Hydnum rufescens UP504]|uniref:DUF4211 domain-containing protein n=1 Tax=Hydnum rufescens UP504 TaxID=1448309 RepID=A0A9P6BDT3_9AGAM|nr:hypothetical protein BS47DRAFT_1335217 [Hydnum rufescens UP504]
MPKKPSKVIKDFKIQTTLDQFSSSPSRNITSKPKSNQLARPRRRASNSERISSDDSDGIGVVKFEKNRPTRKVVISSSSESDSDSRLSHTAEINGSADRRRRHRRPRVAVSSNSDVGSISSPESSPPATDDDHKPHQPASTKGKKREFTLSSDSNGKPRAKRPRVLANKPDSALASPRSGDSDDDSDLLAELDADRIIESRFRAPKRSAYSRSLDQLKRRKNGPTKSAEKSHDESGSGAVSHDSEGDDFPFDGLFESSVPSGNMSDDDILDDEPLGTESEVVDDNFIVEDDGLGAVILPPEFSMDSHQAISDDFKVICQMYVHMAVAKSRSKFSRISQKDSYFSVPLNMVRRKLSGLRDSLVASSIWKSDFKSTLDYYPEASITPLMTSTPLGRVPTISFRVFGPPYDRDTLVPIDASDDESREDDDSNSQSFDLGRFCARRAQVYHSFSHWEYALFSVLQQEVCDLRDPEGSGRGRFIRVNWGDPDEVPKDVNDPDQIVDWLDSRGIIKHEYAKIKQMMEDARTLDFQGKGGHHNDFLG